MKKADKKRYVVTPDWEEMIKIKNVAKFLFLYLTIDFWNSVLLSSVDSVMVHMYIKVASIDCIGGRYSKSRANSPVSKLKGVYLENVIDALT